MVLPHGVAPGARGSNIDATPLNQLPWFGASEIAMRSLARSVHENRVLRGSFDAIASPLPAGNGYVTSTTTIGRAPPGSKPILARTVVGTSGCPSTETVSGAIANAARR